MHRFFVNRDQIREKEITLTGEEYHHLTHVLRVGSDEVFEICDGLGTDYHCVISENNGTSACCRILKSLPSQGESDISYTLYQGLPKGSKMDEIVQKNTELGICKIIPFESMRTVVGLKGKSDKKIERWQKIAHSAAKQSKRGRIPAICPPVQLSQIEKAVGNYDLFILCYEEEREGMLKTALEKVGKRPASIALLIGPEGGLDPTEAAMLTESGAISVSLGHRILRTETAGQAVLSQLNFYFGESANES